MAQSTRVAIWVCPSASPGEKVKMFSLSEKVKVLDIRKKLYADFAKIYSKNKSSPHDIVKKEKEIYARFAVTLQTAKVTAKVISSDGKGIKSGVVDVNREGPHFIAHSPITVPIYY